MLDNVSFGNEVKGLRINRLLMSETGTYNPMFHRPYITNTNSLGSVMENLEINLNNQNVSSKSNILPEMLSQAVGSIVTPSAQPIANAVIPNNWNEKRIMFVLEVEVDYSLGTHTKMLFQGFTDHLGVGYNGSIDEEMMLYINSYTTMIPSTIVGQFGKEINYRIIDSGRVLTSFVHLNAYEQNPLVLVRPMDVFTSGKNEMYDLPSHGLLDSRMTLTPRTAKVSTRKNDIPTNYLSRMLDGYRQGVLRSDISSSQTLIQDAAIGITSETAIETNPFIRQLMSIKEFGSASAFKYKDLLKLDFSINQRTQFIRNSGVQLQKLHQVGTTENWGGVNRETQIATILSSAIPSLMLDSLFGSISFSATNDTPTGQHVVMIVGYKGLVDADLRRNAELFIQRLTNEVLNDISFGSQIKYFIEINANINFETGIKISLEGKPPVPFNSPTFCDSIISPVVSTLENQQVLASDMNTIVTNVIESLTLNVQPVTGMKLSGGFTNV